MHESTKLRRFFFLFFSILLFSIFSRSEEKIMGPYRPNATLPEISEEQEILLERRTRSENYNSKSINFREFTRRITPPSNGRKTPNLLDIVSISSNCLGFP